MDYINQEKPEGCIFCTFPAEQDDRKNLLLGRSFYSFAILNRFPYNCGHLMVVPKRHVADLNVLPEEEFEDLHRLLRLSVSILIDVYQPEGVNLGMNLGRSAGAGIADHLHYHAVPRWNGDTNFMPVIAGTKVMVEHLDNAFLRLREKFDQALPNSSSS
jgi:ATP adenylyltransferase